MVTHAIGPFKQAPAPQVDARQRAVLAHDRRRLAEEEEKEEKEEFIQNRTRARRDS